MTTTTSAARVAARHLAKSRLATDAPNPLDTVKSRQAGVGLLNKVIGSVKLTGIFRDTSWKPVQEVFEALSNAGIELSKVRNEYAKNEEGAPTSKKWTFEAEWKTTEGKSGKPIYGLIIASGAGSIEDPLDQYDVVAYAS